MTVRVRSKPRGPLVIEGDFELLDESGERIDTSSLPKVSLCRCGASKAKPFCDGSHHRVRFGLDDEG